MFIHFIVQHAMQFYPVCVRLSCLESDYIEQTSSLYFCCKQSACVLL